LKHYFEYVILDLIMKKLIKKLLSKKKEPRVYSRKDVENKVAEGTKKALKEYGEAFKMLAKYDRESWK